jgi:hypothetical protein
MSGVLFGLAATLATSALPAPEPSNLGRGQGLGGCPHLGDRRAAAGAGPDVPQHARQVGRRASGQRRRGRPALQVRPVAAAAGLAAGATDLVAYFASLKP